MSAGRFVFVLTEVDLYIRIWKPQEALSPRQRFLQAMRAMKIRQSIRLPACILVLTGVFAFTGPSQAQTPAPELSEMNTVPLPDRNPLRHTPPAPQPELPPHPRERNAEEWAAQDIQAALDRCSMVLDGMGITYQAVASIREGVCGTPAPVQVSSIGSDTKVAIEPPARMTCDLAASLGAWSDSVLQPSAMKHLGRGITAIRNVASYVCRNRYNDATARISEHARANALDMAAFKTSDGEWITVLDHWKQMTAPVVDDAASPPAQAQPQAQTTAPSTGDVAKEEDAEQELTPEAAFLLELHTGGCKLFGTVLGPDANDAHKDHFHFDLAERKHSNYCE